MEDMETLRALCSQADASMAKIDVLAMDEVSQDAVFDLIRVLTAAKVVAYA